MKYRVTQVVDAKRLLEMVEIGLTTDVSIEPIPEIVGAPAPKAAATTQSKRQRGTRGSKVNDTILSALQNGEHSSKELRKVLEGAGLAAGSLSAGLAVLQRQGHIDRVSEGVYALRMAKAAE